MREKVKGEMTKVYQLLKQFLESFLEISARPAMRILPGNLAFFLVLSFAPIITLIALLASRFSIPLLSFLNDFEHMLPNDLFKILEMFFEGGNPPTGSLVIYLLLGFVTASNGAHSIIIASNTLYDIPQDSYIKRRIKAFFLTILLIFQFIFILVFLVYGNILMKWILSFSIFASIRSSIYGSFIFLKWPIIMLVSFVLIKLLYTIAPDKKIGSKNVTRGALFTTVGWTVTTVFYAYYANNMANYSVFYGGLSNLIVLMMWIYFVSYILVLGIAMNVSSSKMDKNKLEK
jgi:membrane protein